MAQECGPDQTVEFRRTDRDYVTWPSTGLSSGAVVTLDLDRDGTWRPVVLNSTTGELSALFAGPDFAVPGSAIVITGTAEIRLHIVDGSVDRTVSGGFVRLLP